MADNRKHTRVVNIRKEAYDVYIGRAGKGQDGYFGNPFRLKQDMIRGGTLAGFREYFYRRLVNDAEYRRRVHELQGKTLGCFCKPHPCHGDIIKEYLDRMAGRGEDIEIGTIFYKGKAYPSREITTGMETYTISVEELGHELENDMRNLLDEAVEWCKARGLEFYAVNKDYPEEQKDHQGFSRKLKADMFIDDRNLGGLPDWGVIYEMIKEKKTFADIYSQNGEEEKTSLKKKKRWLPF